MWPRVRAGARAGGGAGLVAGAGSAVALGVLAPAFLDPAAAAALAVLAAHAVAGALLGGLVGFVAGAPRARGAAAAAVLLAYGGLAVAAARVAGPRGGTPAARPAPGPQVLVIGLDGGTWRVLDPLLAAGELPAFARLVREGTSGVLTSIEPTFSSIVWTSIATGKRPAKHGIHSFYGLQNADLRAGRFWEVVAARGEPVAVFQWLVTWPPDAIPGFVVPGWLARDERTHPPDLAYFKRLEIAFQRRDALGARDAFAIGVRLLRDGLRLRSAGRGALDVGRAVLAGDERAVYRAAKTAQLDVNADVFLSLYARWRPRLAVAVFYGADALSHAYWKYHEPAAFPDVPPAEVAAHGDAVRGYYRRFDEFLGRLLALAGDDATVLLVSDHGFRPAERRHFAISAERLLEAIGEGERFHGQAINNRAYLLHREPSSERAPVDVARAAEKLRAMRHGDEPVLAVEVTGPHSVTAQLRRVGARAEDEIQTPAGPRRMASLVSVTPWSGSHDLDGILLARGPGVRRGVRLARASVLDVAPTVLHLLGLPVAADMDGRVLAEMLAPDAPPPTVVASHDGAMPPRVAAGGGEAEVTERLRTLGYVR